MVAASTSLALALAAAGMLDPQIDADTGVSRLAVAGRLWQKRRLCVVPTARCRSSGVEHSLGKGEAQGSIPCGSTISDLTDADRLFVECGGKAAQSALIANHHRLARNQRLLRNSEIATKIASPAAAD